MPETNTLRTCDPFKQAHPSTAPCYASRYVFDSKQCYQARLQTKPEARSNCRHCHGLHDSHDSGENYEARRQNVNKESRLR
jgi:hypothetical protein